MLDDNDVVGMMMADDGTTLTLVAAPEGALNDAVEVFPTADPKAFVGAIDVRLIALIANLADPQERMSDLAMAIAAVADAMDPPDLSWVYEPLDN